MFGFARVALACLALLVLSQPQRADAQDTWEIDTAHSHVGFKIRHNMVSWVRGSFGRYEGRVEYTPGKPNSLRLDVTIDAKSIDTDNEKRDKHLRSPDFFNVEEFPKLTFKSKSLDCDAAGACKVSGELTMHGVTRSVTLAVEPMSAPLTDPWGNVKIGTSATTTLDRKEWGLTWNKTLDAGGLVVGDEVRLMIDVELVKRK